MGTTLTVVQSVGMVPCFSEAWKNSVNVGVNSSASVLSSLVGMRSGPVALCSLSEDSVEDGHEAEAARGGDRCFV